MSFIIVGLGNPGFDYENTRHNTGRMILEKLHTHFEFTEWKKDKKYNALTSTGMIGKEKVLLMMPEGFMNNSGKSLKHLAGSPKKIEKCLVIYDELDLPLGRFKISFGRGDGGHNGIASVIRAVRSKDFPRVRVGVTQATPSGKLKKPSGEKAVVAHILGKFKSGEEDVLKKECKKIIEAVEVLVTEGRAVAMNRFN